jgi:eukaryotic-like serine/threonine-protein kinase
MSTRSLLAAQDPRQERAFCATLLAMTQGETQEPDPLVGTLVAGKYRIVKQLGEGGMGCVYLAEQQLGSTARKVALKTLHKHLSHDPAIKARFDREAGTVAALEHPNTIQVYDFGAMEDGTLYLVMEFVQGRSVADILEKDGAMPPARVENIMRQVCGSLEEAHGHGIVHRDLKPDNVVLCERAGQKDWVEVLDFGIAKRSSEHDPNEAKLTQQGMVLGTPPYMSPEQFTGQPVDSRSDI